MSEEAVFKRPKITPFLWFNSDLQAAIDMYTSIFPDAIVRQKTYSPEGKIFTATFSLAGQEFIAMDVERQFTFNEAISLFITCEDQAEVDHYWDALLKDGGKELECGWLKDRFGVAWQVCPASLLEYLNSKDKEGAERAKQQMFKQKKIIIADIEKAWRGE
jgi:predicted 3-demethylubiquinone-9 3-methyltransferase (glyoxalase superfamily)